MEIGGKPELLGISIADEHMGHTPLGYRGAGVRKVLGLMGELLAAKPADQHTYILIDELENSLHADSQHMLRQVLEGLGRQETVQVIYVTHSPSMINTMRPASIRVLSRTHEGERAKSVIDNRPFGNNFYRVRSSLGLTPSDSLLYAPITVIVEGVTEVECLPELLMKLRSAGMPGLDDLDTILSHSHFLDGEGDKYEYMTRLAKSQNARPVVFVDGDKVKFLATFKEKHGDVSIVHLDPPTEFEEIVPPEKYISALREVLGDTSGTMIHSAFESWRPGQRKQLAFSKMVERWIQDEYDDKPLCKWIVMKKAIEITDASELKQTGKFHELVTAMRKALPDS
jgi:hypothetical protein